jgi:ATP-dependent DNA helicase RecG
VNKPTLSDLIALGEGFTSEFKRSMPSDLGREICAFANATGGVILIGVGAVSLSGRFTAGTVGIVVAG